MHRKTKLAWRMWS